jgi:hypothetical protein
VLAPNAKLRALVAPQQPEVEEQATDAAAASECVAETGQGRAHRISWARLPRRVFDVDMQHCLNCGVGELKTIAAIKERPVIEKVLKRLGLQAHPPRGVPARKPGAAPRGPSRPRRSDTTHAASGRRGWLGNYSRRGVARRVKTTWVDGYDETPPELRMASKIRKDAGVLPPEVETMRALAGLRRELDAVAGDDVRERALRGRIAALQPALELRRESMQREARRTRVAS